jgi:hypothetical protein
VPLYGDIGSYNYCKTERKPYDDAVVAVLLAMSCCAPGAFAIRSDGDASDWAAGAELLALATGKSLKFGLDGPNETLRTQALSAEDMLLLSHDSAPKSTPALTLITS